MLVYIWKKGNNYKEFQKLLPHICFGSQRGVMFFNIEAISNYGI